MEKRLKALIKLPYRTMLIAQFPLFLIEAKGIYKAGIKNVIFFTKAVNFALTRFTLN